MKPESEVLSAFDWLVLLGCAALGYVIGRPLKMVGGVMVVPLILSATVHGTGPTQLPPPSWLIAIMQLVIGCIAGSRFAGVRWHEVRTSVVQGLAWTAIMLMAALAAAVLCSMFVDASVPALLLAFASGGIAEMTIVAFAMGIEVAFVICCHVFRSIFLVVGAPALYRKLHKVYGRRRHHRPEGRSWRRLLGPRDYLHRITRSALPSWQAGWF